MGHWGHGSSLGLRGVQWGHGEFTRGQEEVTEGYGGSLMVNAGSLRFSRGVNALASLIALLPRRSSSSFSLSSAAEESVMRFRLQ